jgi:hypothetical protein
MHLRSWLGPNSHQASFLREIIATAPKVERVVLEGQTRLLVKTARIPELDEQLWIDPDRYVVIRWRQHMRNIERDRVFTVLELNPGPRDTDEAAEIVSAEISK